MYSSPGGMVDMLKQSQRAIERGVFSVKRCPKGKLNKTPGNYVLLSITCSASLTLKVGMLLTS